MNDITGLLRSYRQITFRVTETDPAIDIRVGRFSAPLDELLQRHGAWTAALITAFNPRSRYLWEMWTWRHFC